MKKLLFVGVFCLFLLTAAGCGNRFTAEDLALAREEAYHNGYQCGYETGAEESRAEGYASGFSDGQAEGYSAGLAEQQEALLQEAGDSYQQGYESGYGDGYAKQESDAAAAASAYVSNVRERTGASSGKVQQLVPTAPAGDGDAGRSLPGTGGTVYVTKSGKKYHADGCAYLSSSKIAIALDDAKAKGYTPCSKCNPPK
ncbi:MAG: hypothetical protein IJT76_03490 [Clostridia bacterium]|nr:hypothetical protein [Clostridia bacterium]